MTPLIIPFIIFGIILICAIVISRIDCHLYGLAKHPERERYKYYFLSGFIAYFKLRPKKSSAKLTKSIKPTKPPKTIPALVLDHPNLPTQGHKCHINTTINVEKHSHIPQKNYLLQRTH